MTRLLWLAPLLVACAAEAPATRPGYAGQHLYVQVTGFAANEGKAQRCNDEVQRSGYVPDPMAPVHAVLILEGNTNRLQIVSQARGIVRNEDLPGWDMGRLCRTAIEGILPVLAQEPPPGSYAAAPPSSAPSVQLQPAPTPYDQQRAWQEYYARQQQQRRPPPAAKLVQAPSGPPALLPPPADAPKSVTELARRGEQSFARNDYANALVAYAEADRISSSPPMVFDTAVCYRMLNRPQEALRYVQLYLDRAPQAPNRADAERFADDLRRMLGQEE
jgi:hypothetical protein